MKNKIIVLLFAVTLKKICFCNEFYEIRVNGSFDHAVDSCSAVHKLSETRLPSELAIIRADNNQRHKIQRALEAQHGECK